MTFLTIRFLIFAIAAVATGFYAARSPSQVELIDSEIRSAIDRRDVAAARIRVKVLREEKVDSTMDAALLKAIDEDDMVTAKARIKALRGETIDTVDNALLQAIDTGEINQATLRLGALQRKQQEDAESNHTRFWGPVDSVSPSGRLAVFAGIMSIVYSVVSLMLRCVDWRLREKYGIED